MNYIEDDESEKKTGWFDVEDVLPEYSVVHPVWTINGDLEMAFYSRLSKKFYDPNGGIVDVLYWHSSLGTPF
jgi:hypothetical protein